MNKKQVAAGLGVVVCLFSGGYATGQLVSNNNAEHMFRESVTAQRDLQSFASDYVGSKPTIKDQEQFDILSEKWAASQRKGVRESDFIQKVVAENMRGLAYDKEQYHKLIPGEPLLNLQRLAQAQVENVVEMSYLQVMQNQRLIEQNDRIISLLEQQVKAKK